MIEDMVAEGVLIQDEAESGTIRVTIKRIRGPYATWERLHQHPEEFVLQHKQVEESVYPLTCGKFVSSGPARMARLGDGDLTVPDVVLKAKAVTRNETFGAQHMQLKHIPSLQQAAREKLEQPGSVSERDRYLGVVYETGVAGASYSGYVTVPAGTPWPTNDQIADMAGEFAASHGMSYGASEVSEPPEGDDEFEYSF